MKYSEVKFKKGRCIKNMTSLSKIKVCNENRNVDPLILFKWRLIHKKCDDELKSNLKYELSPYPSTIFDDEGTRKTQKSKLYDLFPEYITTVDTEMFSNVVDSGFLLRKVPWERQTYVLFVRNKYCMLNPIMIKSVPSYLMGIRTFIKVQKPQKPFRYRGHL